MATFDPNFFAVAAFVTATATLATTAGEAEALVIAPETAPFPDNAAFRAGSAGKLADCVVLELPLGVTVELDRTAWASACTGSTIGSCVSVEPSLSCIETREGTSPNEEAVSSAPFATAVEGLPFAVCPSCVASGPAAEDTLSLPPFESAAALDWDRADCLGEAADAAELD